MLVDRMSLRNRLKAYVFVFVLLLVGVSVVSALRLGVIDRESELIGNKWLVAMGLVGRLDHHLSDFRIAEADQLTATSAGARVAAERAANENRTAVDDIVRRYSALLGPSTLNAELGSFVTAWHTYRNAHDSWTAQGTAGAADHGAELHSLYANAHSAIERLYEANIAAAEVNSQDVDRLVDRTIYALLVVSAITVLFGAWLLLRLRRKLAMPLAAITDALTRLAEGDRDVRVPELNRTDEIGAMAKAFDVFRANALELQKAHEATRAAQEEALALARHDALTGLPNRRLFFAELDAAIARTKDSASVCSVLLIDLDRFKSINDLQGHPIGDLVLCEVAGRLSEAIRREDTVARLGGDEFAIVADAVDGRSYTDRTIHLARRLLRAIEKPIQVGDTSVTIGASIGIATCPADGSDPDALLRAADIAMYRAKHEGRGTFRFFEGSMDKELRDEAAFEAELRQAIAEGQIRPAYQPLIDMKDQKVYGFEILARWQHPERGAIPPDRFIPLAEQLGLISDLTWSVLRQACRDAVGWPKDIQLSLNISPTQLKDPALPMQLLSVLNEEGFRPSRLEIEVTETALISDLPTAKAILTALQVVGIKVSLDDFGTGYSSLYHLRELKFDKVKIDRSFVQSMEENADSEKIVDAILSLARNLGLPAVAEGIENRAVIQHLIGKGCDYGQGYYFGKAMPADEATQALGTDRAAHRNVG